MSQMADLSVGVLCDILSSAQAGDVQVSSGLPGVSGLSVFLLVISSSVPRIVPDVLPSHYSSTPAIPLALSWMCHCQVTCFH